MDISRVILFIRFRKVSRRRHKVTQRFIYSRVKSTARRYDKDVALKYAGQITFAKISDCEASVSSAVDLSIKSNILTNEKSTLFPSYN